MLARLLERLDTWQRQRRWAAFPLAVVKKFGDDRAGHLAALVAYYSFFSIFPLLLVFTTLLGIVLEDSPDLRERLLDSALGQVPLVGEQLQDDVGRLPGSGLALAVGLGGALWGGMAAVLAMQNALDSVWNVPLKDRANLVAGRLRALAMLTLVGAGIVALTVAGSAVRSALGGSTAGDLAATGVSFVLAVGLFLVAFRLLTDAPTTWRDVAPGAVVAGLAWSVLQAVGAVFVRRSIQGAESTAGVFAVVIGLLSWLYLVAQVTVLSAEINVVRRDRLWPRSLTGHDLGEGDQRALARYAAVEQRVEGHDLVVDLKPPAVVRALRTPARVDEPG